MCIDSAHAIMRKATVLQGGSLPVFLKVTIVTDAAQQYPPHGKYRTREVVRMEMFSFQDLILFATFLITLLTYIDRNNKRKK